MSDIKPWEKHTAHVIFAVKGGCGKTETADVLEAALSLGQGLTPLMVDADDGNAGLTRRVSKDRTVKLNWANGPAEASSWLNRHAADADSIIFDVGSGLLSSDMPVIAYVGMIWRGLHDRGWRVVFHCVTSTNAPSMNFYPFLMEEYGSFAEFMVILNNQDGSSSFLRPADSPTVSATLGYQCAGLQELRLSRKELLSEIIKAPTEDFNLATRMIASRVRSFAGDLSKAELLAPGAAKKLDPLARSVCGLFKTQSLSKARDEKFRLNEALDGLHQNLLSDDLTDEVLLYVAKSYRDSYRRYFTD